MNIYNILYYLKFLLVMRFSLEIIENSSYISMKLMRIFLLIENKYKYLMILRLLKILLAILEHLIKYGLIQLLTPVIKFSEKF